MPTEPLGTVDCRGSPNVFGKLLIPVVEFKVRDTLESPLNHFRKFAEDQISELEEPAGFHWNHSGGSTFDVEVRRG